MFSFLKQLAGMESADTKVRREMIMNFPILKEIYERVCDYLDKSNIAREDFVRANKFKIKIEGFDVDIAVENVNRTVAKLGQLQIANSNGLPEDIKLENEKIRKQNILAFIKNAIMSEGLPEELRYSLVEEYVTLVPLRAAEKIIIEAAMNVVRSERKIQKDKIFKQTLSECFPYLSLRDDEFIQASLDTILNVVEKRNQASFALSSSELAVASSWDTAQTLKNQRFEQAQLTENAIKARNLALAFFGKTPEEIDEIIPSYCEDLMSVVVSRSDADQGLIKNLVEIVQIYLQEMQNRFNRQEGLVRAVTLFINVRVKQDQMRDEFYQAFNNDKDLIANTSRLTDLYTELKDLKWARDTLTKMRKEIESEPEWGTKRTDSDKYINAVLIKIAEQITDLQGKKTLLKEDDARKTELQIQSFKNLSAYIGEIIGSKQDGTSNDNPGPMKIGTVISHIEQQITPLEQTIKTLRDKKDRRVVELRIQHTQKLHDHIREIIESNQLGSSLELRMRLASMYLEIFSYWPKIQQVLTTIKEYIAQAEKGESASGSEGIRRAKELIIKYFLYVKDDENMHEWLAHDVHYALKESTILRKRLMKTYQTWKARPFNLEAQLLCAINTYIFGREKSDNIEDQSANSLPESSSTGVNRAKDLRKSILDFANTTDKTDLTRYNKALCIFIVRQYIMQGDTGVELLDHVHFPLFVYLGMYNVEGYNSRALPSHIAVTAEIVLGQTQIDLIVKACESLIKSGMEQMQREELPVISMARNTTASPSPEGEFAQKTKATYSPPGSPRDRFFTPSVSSSTSLKPGEGQRTATLPQGSPPKDALFPLRASKSSKLQEEVSKPGAVQTEVPNVTPTQSPSSRFRSGSL